MFEKLKTKWAADVKARRVDKARKMIKEIERSFMNSSFDFLTSRGWVPTPDKPGYWTRVKPGEVTIVTSFREAIQRTLT
jgi:hypothetical protein